MADNITFRSGLVGGLADFCNESHLSIIANPVIFVELIVLLARYKEEGVGLHPKVYITNDINLCNAMIGNAETFEINDPGYYINHFEVKSKARQVRTRAKRGEGSFSQMAQKKEPDCLMKRNLCEAQISPISEKPKSGFYS